MSLLTLFSVVFFASSAYLLLPRFLNPSLLFDGFHHLPTTTLHFTLYSLLRVLCGSVHSLLFYYGIVQLSLLLAIQLANLSLLVINRKAYQRKTVLVFNFYEQVMRVVLQVVLILEEEVGGKGFEGVMDLILVLLFAMGVGDLFGGNIPEVGTQAGNDEKERGRVNLAGIG